MDDDLPLALGQLQAEIDDQGRRITVRLRGDLDIATAPQFRAVTAPLRDRDLTLDLSRLDLVDSSGLREIVRLRDDLQPDHELSVVAVEGGLPWHLIALAKLAGVLRLHSA